MRAVALAVLVDETFNLGSVEEFGVGGSRSEQILRDGALGL